MKIQLIKQREYGYFTAHEVAVDGSIVNRRKTLVAHMPDFTLGVSEPGSVWEVSGRVVQNSFKLKEFVVYEEVIKVNSAKFIRPSGEILARWICYNIEGVGEVKARRLVRSFANLDEIVRSGDVGTLSSVSGVSEDSARALINNWPSRALYEALNWLQESKLPMRLADRLARIYGDGVVDKLTHDPFVLVTLGLSFEEVLRIIKKLNLVVSNLSIYAAITEKIFNHFIRDTGSTIIAENELLAKSKSLCAQLKLPVDNLIESSLKAGMILPVDDGYQLLGCAIQEATVGRFLNERAHRKAGADSLYAGWERNLNLRLVEAALSQFESTLDFNLTNEQRNAVVKAVLNNVAVISGGAGTGKTTILLAVLSVYESLAHGMALYQVALSGRAARRMSETTGRPAMTIAKFTAEFFNNVTGNSKNSLPNHLLLVVDEASMIDLLSAYKLVGLLPSATRILLVGDVGQLPPVGPGLVFHAVMKSKIPSFELTQVKRQSEESVIHNLATAIRNGVYDSSLLRSSSGDVIYSADASNKNILSEYARSGGVENCIILTPVRKGLLGVENINSVVQSQFDASSPSSIHFMDGLKGWTKWLTKSGSKLRLGDQIMVVENDYEVDLRNGDIGRVVEVSGDSRSSVLGLADINGFIVEITISVLEKLELAYAITIHKAQGSQWNSCILLLPDYAKPMLDQTILYTAVTRSCRNLIILGDETLIESAINRGSLAQARKTHLLHWLSF